MDRILVLDSETTGLIPGTDRTIEIAVALYDLEHATVISTFSSLLRHDSNAAEAINNIPPAALADRGFVPASLLVWPWVCSKFDLKWPKQTRLGGSLVPLALEHGLGVATAHRATADVDLLCRLFTRAHDLGEDLRAMMAYGMRPKGKIQALVSFEEKDLAKVAGFQWDGAEKTWTRVMALDDAKILPFKWRKIADVDTMQARG